MCSIQEGSFPEKATKSLQDLKCVKCKREEVPVVATRVNDAFCRDCFLVYAVHKFRSAIGKSKAILPRDRVLLAYSGGPMSTALLHFVQQGIQEKKLRFSVSVLHISELSLVSMTDENRKHTVETVVEKVKAQGFPLFLSSIEKAMEMNAEGQTCRSTVPVCDALSRDSNTGTDLVHDTAVDMLTTMLDCLSSVSAREDFLRVFRNQLMVAIARQRGFDKVMVGETATMLSVRMMTDIAKGRGAQVSLDTTIADKRNGDVTVVRPLRDLNEKEVDIYNRLHNITCVPLPSLKDKWTISNSIEQLTGSFIKGLDYHFPSTVPNIMRTSAKLCEGERQQERQQCVLCQSPLDTHVGEASALRAVQVSECLQTRGRASSNDRHSALSDSSLSSIDGIVPSIDAVRACLCYGCRLLVKNVKETTILPMHMMTGVESRIKMREAITEFLIEDDDGSSS